MGLILGRAHHAARTGLPETTAMGGLAQPDNATSPARERLRLDVSHPTVGDLDKLHGHQDWSVQLVEGWVLSTLV